MGALIHAGRLFAAHRKEHFPLSSVRTFSTTRLYPSLSFSFPRDSTLFLLSANCLSILSFYDSPVLSFLRDSLRFTSPLRNSIYNLSMTVLLRARHNVISSVTCIGRMSYVVFTRQSRESRFSWPSGPEFFISWFFLGLYRNGEEKGGNAYILGLSVADYRDQNYLRLLYSRPYGPRFLFSPRVRLLRFSFVSLLIGWLWRYSVEVFQCVDP